MDALSESIVIFTPLADALLALLDALLPLQMQNNDVNESFVHYAIKTKNNFNKIRFNTYSVSVFGWCFFPHIGDHLFARDSNHLWGLCN